MPIIELIDVVKRYADGTVALDGVNLHVPEGARFGLIGPSGAGKSSLARLVEGLDRPSSGAVRVHGNDLATEDERALIVARRRIGVVFQHGNLLQQRTVEQNVALPLDLAGVPFPEQRARTQELLRLVGLSDYAHRYPAKLSGGQKQRVGIARALAHRPSLLVLDEATSALDHATATTIVELLRDLQERAPMTMLVITHQLEVVHALCTHVAVLERGRVSATGSVREVLGSGPSAAPRFQGISA